MLHELVSYARANGLTAEPGFKPKQVRWLLTFDAQGRFLGVTELGDTASKKNKGQLFNACPDLTQPELIAAGAGSRHFLADNAEVVAKVTKKSAASDLDKLDLQHRYFTARLRDAAVDVAELGPVADALDTEESLAAITRALVEHGVKPTELVTIAVTPSDGDLRILLAEDCWHNWWRSFRQALAEQRSGGGDDEGQQMICLLSGKRVPPVATHPKIEGLADVGASSMGAALISFDKDCFRSFGLEQSANAAMSEQMAATYRGALNHILREQSQRLAGARVAYWYVGAKAVAAEIDPLALFMEGLPTADEDEQASPETSAAPDDSLANVGRDMAPQQALTSAGALLDAIRSGQRPDLMRARFCALILSGNAGRVVVRDWMEGSFEQLLINVNAWFDDLAIVARDGSHVVASHKLMALLGATVRDLKDVSAPMSAALWRAAVLNLPIPVSAAAQALARLRVDIVNDNSIPHPRIALLKAYLIRPNDVNPQGDRNMTAHLNEDHPDPAYHCGRLMAVLADIQYKALGDVGANVVQRYYAAASATPALILGRLVRTAQFHLDKIDPGLRHWHEQRLAAIWGRFQNDIPTTLSLQQQTLFAMGYYQQKAHREPKATTVEAANGTA